jgi:hypothetical protein
MTEQPPPWATPEMCREVTAAVAAVEEFRDEEESERIRALQEVYGLTAGQAEAAWSGDPDLLPADRSEDETRSVLSAATLTRIDVTHEAEDFTDELQEDRFGLTATQTDALWSWAEAHEGVRLPDELASQALSARPSAPTTPVDRVSPPAGQRNTVCDAAAVQVLLADPSGRWAAGEQGVITHRFGPDDKYDYEVTFAGAARIADLFGRGPVDVVRRYLFHADEVAPARTDQPSEMADDKPTQADVGRPSGPAVGADGTGAVPPTVAGLLAQAFPAYPVGAAGQQRPAPSQPPPSRGGRERRAR